MTIVMEESITGLFRVKSLNSYAETKKIARI
jgi:hypothetical protein